MGSVVESLRLTARMATPHRDELVSILERVIARLESASPDVSGTGYISPQQPLGDIAQRLWHIRRGNFARLHHLFLLFADQGPLARLARSNGWASELEALRTGFLHAFAALNRIRYFGTEEAVELGDHVEIGGLLGRRRGRVTYLPGSSAHNAELDFGGLFRVGIGLDGGRFTAVHVDPDSLDLAKSVTLVRRDASDVPPPPTEAELRE
jgi:hypothetical protein